jgi:hypothetical protein
VTGRSNAICITRSAPPTRNCSGRLPSQQHRRSQVRRDYRIGLYDQARGQGSAVFRRELRERALVHDVDKLRGHPAHDILEFGDEEIERYADVLTKTVAAVARAGRDAGAAELQPIAGEIWMGRLAMAGGPSHDRDAAGGRVRNETLRAQVFIRDRFRCTYCGGRAVPRCILVAFHDLFPDQVSYDVHYGRGKMHPVFWALAPEADHVLAHSRGGANES